MKFVPKIYNARFKAPPEPEDYFKQVCCQTEKCDACQRQLNGENAFLVPHKQFYYSPAYRSYYKSIHGDTIDYNGGVSMDDKLDMDCDIFELAAFSGKFNDIKHGCNKVVCKNCIYMFMHQQGGTNGIR